MKLEKKMLDAINAQIGHELFSAYLYLSMAAYFDAENLPGFGHWMKVQAKEEYGHAMRFYEYVYDRQGKVVFPELPRPTAAFASPLDAFRQTLAHEQKVTGLIAGLSALAAKLGDAASSIKLQWFVTEQVEEEKQAGLIIDQLERFKDNNIALVMLDRELAKRE